MIGGIKMTIGQRIKARRIALGLTQDELARRLGYKTKDAISKIETRDSDMKINTIDKFAHALNCSVEYLTGKESIKIGDVDADLIAMITKNESLQTFIKLYNDLSPEHQNDIIKQMEYFRFLENKE